jgi:hypothetical protein
VTQGSFSPDADTVKTKYLIQFGVDYTDFLAKTATSPVTPPPIELPFTPGVTAPQFTYTSATIGFDTGVAYRANQDGFWVEFFALASTKLVPVAQRQMSSSPTQALNFNWGTSPVFWFNETPVTDDFSLMFSGFVRVGIFGSYTFFLSCDTNDSTVKLWIQEDVVPRITACNTQTVVSSVTSNSYLRLRIEYRKGHSVRPTYLSLQWQGPNMSARQVIPTSSVFGYQSTQLIYDGRNGAKSYFGPRLLAEFFSNSDFTGPPLASAFVGSKIDSILTPAPVGVPATNYWVRWSGYYLSLSSGEVRLFLLLGSASDTARLWLGNYADLGSFNPLNPLLCAGANCAATPTSSFNIPSYMTCGGTSCPTSAAGAGIYDYLRPGQLYSLQITLRRVSTTGTSVGFYVSDDSVSPSASRLPMDYQFYPPGVALGSSLPVSTALSFWRMPGKGSFYIVFLILGVDMRRISDFSAVKYVGKCLYLTWRDNGSGAVSYVLRNDLSRAPATVALSTGLQSTTYCFNAGEAVTKVYLHGMSSAGTISANAATINDVLENRYCTDPTIYWAVLAKVPDGSYVSWLLCCFYFSDCHRTTLESSC